jgi:glycosyltransferase involved in cell wall biosynthesis
MKISVVVPVYKEEHNIKPFLDELIPILNNFKDYEVIFALDPAYMDNTENVIKKYCIKNNKIKLIIFSRKFGQPAAMLAGLRSATGDVMVVMDVDLQDPPVKIKEMYDILQNENVDVVLAKRKSKIGENFLRKIIANIGYFFINKLSDTKIPFNVGEFRIMKKKVVDHIISLNEGVFFLRGANSFVGFKTKIIEFDRKSRVIGSTKYNKYTGSLSIGLNGIFLYSTKPLHFITLFSFLFFLTSAAVFLAYILLTFFNFFVFKYQFFTIVLILLLSSLIFISLGIIAEYIARIIPDIKKRPTYIIDKKINLDEK